MVPMIHIHLPETNLMIPFEKFRRVLEMREADRVSNASIIAENVKLKQEIELLRQQLAGKIFDL